MNVLFIAVDDLRPQLRCYGHEEMVTPSLDRLARQGRRFNCHFVQVPTCGASRCALLTGQYPAMPAAYDNDAFRTLPRSRGKPPLSLPALFQANGYTTVSIGKISHEPNGRLTDGEPELPFGWDEVGMPHGTWQDAMGRLQSQHRVERISALGQVRSSSADGSRDLTACLVAAHRAATNPLKSTGMPEDL
jgi:iduronate 2-sulfatase